MHRARKIIESAVDASLVAGMVAMSLFVLVNVILRYGFHSGIPFSVEVSRLIFVWIVFVGAVAAMAEGSHLSVFLLAGLAKGKTAFVLSVSTQAVMLWCCYLIGRGSYALAIINWNNKSPISGIPVAFLYGAGVFFAVGCGLVLAFGIWRTITGGSAPVTTSDGETPQ